MGPGRFPGPGGLIWLQHGRRELGIRARHLKRKWGLQGLPQYRPGGGKETRGIQHITPQKGRGWVAVQGGGAGLQAQGAIPPAGWDPALQTSRAGRKEGGVKPEARLQGLTGPGLADGSGWRVVAGRDLGGRVSEGGVNTSKPDSKRGETKPQVCEPRITAS